MIEEFEFFNAEKTCKEHFNTDDLKTLSLNQRNTAVCALGAAISYLRGTQKRDLENIKEINFYTDAKFMSLGISAIRNLELLETMRDRDRKGSLLWVLDKTKTAMGKRLMRGWLEKPLISITGINLRQNAVEELCSDTVLRGEIAEYLSGIRDVERLMSRVVYGTASARDLIAVSATAHRFPMLKDLISSVNCKMLKEIYSDIDTLERAQIIRDLRLDVFDVLVGINLLREGLDIPEITLVAILDADKEGFLRSHRSLTQTVGRAARNLNGRAIMYADVITESMALTIEETNRRRQVQLAYNEAHHIIPKPISKEQTMGDLLQAGNASEQRAYVEPQPSPVVLAAERELHTPEQMEREIDSLRKRMQKAAKELNFVDAALLRDEMLRLQAELEQKNVQR